MRPASERDLIPVGPIAWCWSLEKQRKEEGKKRKKKKTREMAIRPENVPLPLLLLQNRVQTRLSFPLPAPAMHACFYQIASFQGTKHQHYLDYQMLEETGRVMGFFV